MPAVERETGCPVAPGRAVARVLVLVTAVVLAGCQATGALRSSAPLPERVDSAHVLLMQPDVELAELTAGGLLEVKADWTALGRQHVDAALADFFAERGARLTAHEPPPEGTPDHEAYQQVVLLHRAVGVSVLVHGYQGPLALPTKGKDLDWSLGPQTRTLQEAAGADYALFVFLHDSYASAGRVGMMIFAAAFGVGIQGGIQSGFASLVDLRSGDLVWFNRLVSTTGDLREAAAARSAVDGLLAELPL